MLGIHFAHKHLFWFRLSPMLGLTLVISSQVRVFLYKGFLSNKECEHLISQVNVEPSPT